MRKIAAVGRRQLIANAIRRRLWNYLFRPQLMRLGHFFLDPIDHIGAERIIQGERYEFQQLSLIRWMIDNLGLGEGTVIDVGANIGNHSQEFAHSFSDVVAIEPNRIASLIMQANIENSECKNVRIVQCAFGDMASDGELISQNPENIGNSLVRPVQRGGNIKIVKGDDLISELKVGRVELIKVDVEGAELEVMRGLMRTITRDTPLLCIEVESTKRWDELRELLRPLGYEAAFVASSSNGRGLADRLREFLSGRNVGIVRLTGPFNRGGYKMIFLMTIRQAKSLDLS